jgi:hypothetical protein
MELQIFTTVNLTRTYGGSPSLTVAPQNYVRINRALAKQLGLKHGDKLAVAQNTTEPKNWYLITKHKDGFLLKSKDPKKDSGFNLQSAELVRKMREGLGIRNEPKGVRFSVSSEPVSEDKPNIYAILTAKPHL